MQADGLIVLKSLLVRNYMFKMIKKASLTVSYALLQLCFNCPMPAYRCVAKYVCYWQLIIAGGCDSNLALQIGFRQNSESIMDPADACAVAHGKASC